MCKLLKLPVSLCLLTLMSNLSLAEGLKETYQKALENDHSFKAAEAAYEAGKQNKALGRAGLLPQISGSGSWTQSTTEDTPATVPATNETTTKTYGISLQQAIFDLNAWHSYKRGSALSDAAESQFRQAELNVLVRTAEAYFAVLQASDSLETSKAEENALSHQLEQTKQRFEVGLTAITEVHEAQAAFDTANAGRLIAEGQLAIAFEGLEVITGTAYNSVPPMKRDFPVVNPDPLDREEWVKFAMENNPSLKASSMQAKAAKQLAKAERADHFPTLRGELGYSNAINDADVVFPGQAEERATERIGLTLDIPIFAGGSNHASRRQANYSAIEAKEQFKQNQRDTVQNTRSQHLLVVTGVASVKARAQAITSSQSALDATQAGYEVGTRDLVDVLNAQRSLYAAQRDYFDALYEYVLSTLRLKEVAGTLTPDAIDQLDAWLDDSKAINRS